MKLAAVMVALGVVAAMGLAGCNEEKAAMYDPEVDGVLPHPDMTPEASILDNQKKLYEAWVAAGGGMKAPASAPAAAPATAPATPAPGPEAPAAPAPAAPPSGG
jgi:hypothetical protein